MAPTAELRTDAEKARDAKHRAICNDFLTLSNSAPGAAAHRLFRVIADKYEMTVPSIRRIVINAGLYNPN